MDYELARRLETWLIALAGLAWFAVGAGGGLAGIIAAAIPGGLMLTAAAATILFPGDRRIQRFGATGAAAGILFALPMLLAAPLSALLLAALSAAAGLGAARLAAEDLALPDDQPVPELDARLSAEIALDESVLGTLSTMMGVYNSPIQERVGEELEALLDWLRAGGWLDAPEDFHEAPPPLGPVSVGNARAAGLDFEVMRYASEFEPRPGAPGRDRWLDYANNRTAEARILRARGSRDWLVCIHGLGMGRSWLDMYAMRAGWLRGRGLNLAMPVLPLHGSRATGTGIASGKGFLVGDVANTLHGMTQAMWDFRRLIAWLRDEGAERIGVYGLSLGGYSTALLASLEEDLDCAIVGIPPSEFGELSGYHASGRALWLAEQAQITAERMAVALTPVSPLALRPKVPRDARFVFGGVADRFVPAAQVEALWRHWERPEIHWYRGGHLSFRFHASVQAFVDRALDATVLRPHAGPQGDAR